MSCALRLAEPSDYVYRVGRRPNPWALPDWSNAGDDRTFGNRWDDPKGHYRVVYAATERLSAFVETLSRFRPDPAVTAELEKIEGDDADPDPAPGVVPGSWMHARLVGRAKISGTYADVGHSTSLAYLRHTMASTFRRLGVVELDGAALRTKLPRSVTQNISRHVYECSRDGQRLFSGIYYQSRFGDDLHNWALFEPLELQDVRSDEVSLDDADLQRALEMLDLQLDASTTESGDVTLQQNGHRRSMST